MTRKMIAIGDFLTKHEVAFALAELTAAEEARIAALVKKAVS